MNASPAPSPTRLRRRGRAGAATHARCGGDRGPGNARGAVTAEFAVALPGVLLLLAMLLAGAAAGVTQLRLEEAARAGARALARGESPAAVDGIVRTLAGASATAAVADEGEWLSVTVADRVGGPLGSTVPWTLTARASARSETAAAHEMPVRELTWPRRTLAAGSQQPPVSPAATPSVATGPLLSGRRAAA
jgi:Flp pilus assembly protein TadG